MAKWIARLFWLLVGCALLALAAAVIARAALERHPAEVSAKLSAALAEFMPDAEVEFARAELRLSLRGLLHAHVRDLQIRRGRASVAAPRAEFWLEQNGLIARFHSPTVRLAPAERDGVFPAVALGGFNVIAVHNAVVSAPVPLWGETTLRAVNLTAAHRPNGDVLVRMENNQPGQKLSLEAVARQNFTFAARGRAEGFPPPRGFPAQWSADADANIWAEADLKKQRWRIALDAKGRSAAWQNLGAARNISVRAMISQSGGARRIILNAKGRNIQANDASGAANLSIAADISEFEPEPDSDSDSDSESEAKSVKTRNIVVIVDGAGAALSGIGSARLLTAQVYANQNGEDLRATIFTGGERLRLEKLTPTVFAAAAAADSAADLAGLADAAKYVAPAEWESFFANAEYSDLRGARTAAVFAEGEELSGIFGEVVSLRLRASGQAADDNWESRITVEARDVFSPFAGSALAVSVAATLSQDGGGTLRATFAAALGYAEFLFMPLEAPSFRDLRARGDFSGVAGGEWILRLPEARIAPGKPEAERPTAPVISSFPIRVEARDREQSSAFSSAPPSPSITAGFESESTFTSESESESVIQASLFASGDGRLVRDWKVSAAARDLHAAEIWRHIPDRGDLRDLREWFRESLPAGIVPRARLIVDGGGGASGDARVSLSGVFEEGRIVIGDGWPDAENLSGAFSFADDSVAIDGEGVMDGLPISDVLARVPNVSANSVTLFLDIRPAPQPLPRYLQTALELPEAMDYREAVASYDLDGRGALSIAATVPLAEGAPNSFAAKLQIEDGVFSDLQNPSAPPFESASGQLALTDETTSGSFVGAVRGEPAVLNFDGGGDFDFRAEMDAREAMEVAGLNLPMEGALKISLSRHDGATVFVSDLRGVALLLPAPLGKSAEAAAPIRVETRAGTTRLSMEVNGNKVGAVLDGLERGAVGLNADSGGLPDSGFRVVGGADGADLDGWLALAFGDGEMELGVGGEVILTLTNARMMGATVSALTATIHAPRDGPLQTRLASPDLRGKVSIDFAAGSGLAELAYVNLSSDDDGNGGEGGGDDSGMEMFFAPRAVVLTATIAELRRDGELLGDASGVIHGGPDLWRLSDGVLRLGENHLTAEADYIAGPAPRTSVSLRLVASDLSGLTRVLGLGDFVQRGALTVSGKLNWPLPPTELGFAGMSGALRLDASDIRYEAEQAGGAVTGVVNFLSVFSPLSLLTLGFLKAGRQESVLDRVGCDIVIEDGVAKFPGVLIENEDVVINMTGETDLVHRWHDLHGEVKPGDKILKAVGSTLAATGQLPALLVVEVARRVFAKPLSNLGAYQYAIHGDWDDPHYAERGIVPEADEEDWNGWWGR